MPAPSIKKRLSTTGLTDVYIYTGAATFPESSSGLIRIFQDVIKTFGQKWELHEIKELTPKRIQSIDPEKGLLVLPGGHASNYSKILTDEGEALKKWVSDGGKLFAVCGSVYLIAQTSIFNGTKKERLGLFPGEVRGPFMAKTAAHLGQPFTSSVVTVNIKGNKATCYMSGGGTLHIDPETCSRVGTITRIITANPLEEKVEDNPIAITHNIYGSGQVICSTAHPEHDASDFSVESLSAKFSHIDWKKIRDQLTGTREGRVNLLGILLGCFSRPRRRSARRKIAASFTPKLDVDTAEHSASAAYIPSDYSSDSSRCESPEHQDWEIIRGWKSTPPIVVESVVPNLDKMGAPFRPVNKSGK